MFLINSCCCRFTVAPNPYSRSEAPLIANLRGHFAEFLNQRSPERLSILYSPTCVSFSTVSLNVTLRSFSWTFGGQLPNQVVESPFPRYRAHLTTRKGTRKQRAIPAARLPFKRRPSVGILKKLRNINLTAIVYAFQPRLRNRLTLGGIAFPRKP